MNNKWMNLRFRRMLKFDQVIIICGILILATSVRIGHRVFTGSTDFWLNGYTFFYDIAENITAGQGVGLEGAWAIRPPVYPYFLALSKLAGGNYLFIVIP